MAKFTAPYFIRKFKAIRSSKWTTHDFIDEQGRCCALGHCGTRRVNGMVEGTMESGSLASLFHDRLRVAVSNVNDGNGPARYWGITAKSRVLYGLKLIAEEVK